MRVLAHDPDRPPPEPKPDDRQLRFTPFRTIILDRGRELRFDIVDGPTVRSVSARLFTSEGRNRPLKPGRPLHLFGDQIADVVQALTEAAAALGTP